MATAKSCEELQLIGISNNTFKVQAGDQAVSTFCGESGKHLSFNNIQMFVLRLHLIFRPNTNALLDSLPYMSV